MPILVMLKVCPSWSWVVVVVDCCAVCYNKVTEPCYKCQVNGAYVCPIFRGVCNHVFHLHCISDWMATNNICLVQLHHSGWSYQKSY